ncbi:MAG: helix-turn-helix domain-containing protein [Methanosarcinales archaeon]
MRRLFLRQRTLQRSSCSKRAAKEVGVSRVIGYVWLEKWNEKGLEGLKPKPDMRLLSTVCILYSPIFKQIIENDPCYSGSDSPANYSHKPWIVQINHRALF